MNNSHRPATTGKTHAVVTAHQAIENSDALGLLTGRIRESNERLKAIESLLPEGLRTAVKAGPIDGDSWCLLVNSSAAAAKIRQLTPLIQARLQGRGWKLTAIRLKILMGRA